MRLFIESVMFNLNELSGFSLCYLTSRIISDLYYNYISLYINVTLFIFYRNLTINDV